MTAVIIYFIFGLICVACWVYLYSQIMESDYSKWLKFFLLFLTTAFILIIAVIAIGLGILMLGAGGSKGSK